MRPEESLLIDNLFREQYLSLQSHAKFFLGDCPVVEDMVQDTFHEAINHIDTLMQHPAPEKWMKKTLIFKIQNYEKRRNRTLIRFSSLADITQIPSPESVEDQVIKSSLLVQIEEFLGPDDFYLLKKITLERVSHKDIAEELGITVWASAKRLTRIREKLYRKFPEYKDIF